MWDTYILHTRRSCLRDFYNYTTLIDWIFIDVLAILHSICFLLAHRRIMKGRDDVIFVYALCRWSPTFSHHLCNYPLIIYRSRGQTKHYDNWVFSLSSKACFKSEMPQEIAIESEALSSTTISYRSWKCVRCTWLNRSEFVIKFSVLKNMQFWPASESI